MEFLSVSLPEEIIKFENRGNFKMAKDKIHAMLEKRCPHMLKKRLEYELYRIERMRANYPFDAHEANNILKQTIKDFNETEFEILKRENRLDCVNFDGELLFERRFAENLCFAEKSYMARKIPDTAREKANQLLHNRLDELLKGDCPKTYRVRARITKKLIKANEDSKVIKCWLPLPKCDLQQSASSCAKTDLEEFVISGNHHPQRTLFAKKEYQKGKEHIFNAEFEYTISEIVSNVDPDKVQKPTSNMVNFLREQLPHITFTPYLKQLACEIIAGETNPYLIAKRIYDWITLNVRYSFMKEYKFYEDISTYAAVNLKGDCGVQALLFITLCRISGVPARWQSGWYANPLAQGNHDWAFFYCEPYGWLPVDCSFGGARRDVPAYREFYFGNLDAYRLVTTTGFMMPFFPKKEFIRNDPYDNQTGEMETDTGPVESEDTQTIKEIISFEVLSDKIEGKE